jgi:hypothetical protein
MNIEKNRKGHPVNAEAADVILEGGVIRRPHLLQADVHLKH